MADDNPFQADILEKIAVLSKDGKGWTRELRKISYNQKPAVYDLRVWSPAGRFGKGITLDDAAFQKLVEVIKTQF